MKTARMPSKAARWTILTVLVALGLGGVVASLAADRSLKVPPAAYLVAIDDDTTVRLQWKSRKVATALTLPSNTAVAVPAHKKVLLIHPDGRQERLTGPVRIQVPTPASSGLDFLTVPLATLTEEQAKNIPEGDSSIRITSPVSITRFLNPTLSWIASEGVLYDVAVIDPADEAAPPRIARGVRPPVPFSALENKQGPSLPNDRIFAVLVRVVGENGIGGTRQFLTSRDATTEELSSHPAELLAEAVSALAHQPARTGDAWMALSRLPEPWKQSELAMRLRLKVSAELRLPEEIKKVQSELLGQGK